MLRIDLFHMLTSAAESLYGAREAEQIAQMILNEMCGVSRTQLIMNPNEECYFEELDRVVQQLEEGRPVQYIIGVAEFCGYNFVVDERVLIPRPETEELVFRILEEVSPKARILDVGCGSGAIAISLAKSLRDAEVWAMDVSTDALSVAETNAEELGVDVNFVEGDALEGIESYVEGEFDLIVSNPPYIPQSEEELMRSNVLDYEPHLALFVEDDDPLIFYREIARSALSLLSEGGCLYFEIHESFGREMCQMLERMGYVDVALCYDINNKARIVCAEKSS